MAGKGGRPRSIVRDPDTGDVVNGLSRRKSGVFYATGAKPYKSFGDDLKIAIRRFHAWKQGHTPNALSAVSPIELSAQGVLSGLFKSRLSAEGETFLDYLAPPCPSHAVLFGGEYIPFLGTTDDGNESPESNITQEQLDEARAYLQDHRRDTVGVLVADLDAQDTALIHAVIAVLQGEVEQQLADVPDHLRPFVGSVEFSSTFEEFMVSTGRDRDLADGEVVGREGYAQHWPAFFDWVIGRWIESNPKEAASRLGVPELANLEAIRPKPQSITLQAVADLFENKPVGNREYRRRFAKRFREFVKIIGVKTVKEIELEHIEKYYARVLKDSKQGDHGRPYAKSRFDVVTAVLAYAHKRGRDKQEIRRVLDDCQMLEAPRNGTRPKAEARPVTRDELHAILALADARQTAIIMLGINAGFDPVDIQRLPLDAVDLKACVLHFDRTKADAEKPTPRIATLWPRTVKALRKYLKDCPHEAANGRGERMFFATATGKTIREGRTWISRAIWRPLRLAAGQPEECKFKGLRKAAYTEASQVSPRQADILLGHRLPGVTDNYLRRNAQTIAPACRAIEKHYFG